MDKLNKTNAPYYIINDDGTNKEFINCIDSVRISIHQEKIKKDPTESKLLYLGFEKMEVDLENNIAIRDGRRTEKWNLFIE